MPDQSSKSSGLLDWLLGSSDPAADAKRKKEKDAAAARERENVKRAVEGGKILGQLVKDSKASAQPKK